MVPKFVDPNMTFVPSLMNIKKIYDSSSIVPFIEIIHLQLYPTTKVWEVCPLPSQYKVLTLPNNLPCPKYECLYYCNVFRFGDDCNPHEK